VLLLGCFGGEVIAVPNLKQALQDGQVIIGTWMKAPSPSQVEMMGYAGFDFVTLCTEHSSYDVETGESLIRAADAAGLPCLMRVWDNNPVLIGKVLDFGAQGVMVPHIGTASSAHEAVRGARYAPEGIRSASPTVRATHYGQIPWAEHLPRAQADTLIVLQIEGKEGIQNLDEIMDVDGVDVLFIGAFDLAASLGVSGQLDHPRLLDAVGDIVHRAKRKDIRLGIWMPTPEQAGPWIESGVQVVTVSNNYTIFYEACRALVGRLREKVPINGGMTLRDDS
jgi:4-hydroxy-2-oxoheptanedioate aldolase